MNEIEKFVYLLSFDSKETPSKEVIENVRQRANRLVELVKEELEKDYVVIDKEAYKRVLNQYAELRKNDAAKKMPKWKVSGREQFSDTIDFAVKFMNDGGDYPDYETVIATNRLSAGEEYIELADLISLPKEK